MLLDESIECSLKNAIDPRQARSRRGIPALRKPPNELDPRLVRDMEGELQSGALLLRVGRSLHFYVLLNQDVQQPISGRLPCERASLTDSNSEVFETLTSCLAVFTPDE